MFARETEALARGLNPHWPIVLVSMSGRWPSR